MTYFQDLYRELPEEDAEQDADVAATAKILLPDAGTLANILGFAGTNTWRLDKGVSRIAYDRMKTALECITGPTFTGHPALRELVCRVKTVSSQQSSSLSELQATGALNLENKQNTQHGESVAAWIECQTSDGYPYYYHVDTQESSWFPPTMKGTSSSHALTNVAVPQNSTEHALGELKVGT